MELRIAHLYPDLMNIYGDWGNVLTMRYRAERRGIQVQIHQVGVGTSLEPGQYDFYFFGGGQDHGQVAVSEDLPRIASTLKQEVEAGAGLLSVCGGYQLLGASYHTADGQDLPGAHVLPVMTAGGDARMMNNIVVAINPQLSIDRSKSATLVGFENHSGRTQLLDGAMPLGRVIKGNGNNGQDGTEGVVYKAAIGTYLHGSCLPKNPHLADWLLQASLKRNYGEVVLAPLDDELEWQAHRAAVSLKP